MLRRLRGGVGYLLDVVGEWELRVWEPGAPLGDAVEAELGGDDDLVAHRRQGLADDLFVDEGAVSFCGVEEGDAEVDGFVEEVDHLGFVFGSAVGEAHSHAAEAEGGDF